MTRWKAAAIHLALSVAIASSIGLLLLALWYPPPYFHGAGADTLILLMGGVDVVLGPLLTLIVFRSGKKSLKFDLGVIALLQSAALVYGLSVMLQSRPVFLVGAIDRLILVAANELDPQDLAEGSQPQFRSLSWTGPRLVGAARPANQTERDKLLWSGVAGKDLEKFPKYYVEYAAQAQALLAKAKPLDVLRQARPESATVLDGWLQRSGMNPADVLWLPIRARAQDLTMLVARGDGQPLQALAIDPW